MNLSTYVIDSATALRFSIKWVTSSEIFLSKARLDGLRGLAQHAGSGFRRTRCKNSCMWVLAWMAKYECQTGQLDRTSPGSVDQATSLVNSGAYTPLRWTRRAISSWLIRLEEKYRDGN